MEWILPLLLGLLCLVEYPSVFGQDEPKRVMENTAVTIHCPMGNIEYINRNWYRGYFTTEGMSPSLNVTLFSQLSSIPITNVSARADMSVDAANFALKIGSAKLEDDSYFSCRVFQMGEDLQNLFNQTKVEIYIQPIITLHGLENATYKENDTVTVMCIIDRLYPGIQESNFTMTWDNAKPEIEFTSVKYDDGAYRYRVQFKKTLTKEDNGVTVTCNVNPVRGTSVPEEKILNVQYISPGSPNLSVDNEDPYLDDDVIFTCEKGSINGNPEIKSAGLYRDGNLIGESDNSFTITRKVTLNDTGIYKCVVGNSALFSEFSNEVQLNVSTKRNPNPSPGPVSGQSNLVPAIAGGVAGAMLLFLIIVLVVFCRRRRSKDDQGSSTDALTKGQTLDRVVVPPEDFGDAQYTDIEQPAKFKPTPAQRSFRKKPEPIYDVANVNNGLPENEKTLYANVNGAHIPDQSNPPKKPKRQPELANNNTNKPDGVVYAELDLDKKRSQPKNDTRGVMPNREEPTEYARIDFTKSAKQ